MACYTPLTLGKMIVPCGKCNFCLRTKRAEWSYRLFAELKLSSTAHFLTLTYDESNQPWMDSEVGTLPTLCKSDVQLFTKRLRFLNSSLTRDSVRYYTVGEYGTITNRPHYHAIMFNVHDSCIQDIESVWKAGAVHIGDVTEASIHYTTKYVINRPGVYTGREPPFAVMSRRPGIGAGYLTPDKIAWHRKGMRNYAPMAGGKTRLPRYFKDRIFTEDERDQLWIESMMLKDEKFYEEIRRLKEFHDDPYMHYNDRLKWEHDKIKSKCNTQNHF